MEAKDARHEVRGTDRPAQDRLDGEALLGRVLGNFTLQRRLNLGGPNLLFEGRHRFLGTSASVRVCLAPESADEAFHRSFVRRARALLPLRHPNLVTFYEYGAQDRLSYWAVEYVAGVDLAWVLEKYSRRGDFMPVEDGLLVVDQIASALDHLHAKGIAHGNLKPSNVLLDRQGRVALTDFAMGPDIGLHAPSAETPPAPEAVQRTAEGGPGSTQQDLRSLGAILHRILVGVLPMDGAGAKTLWKPPSTGAQGFADVLDPELETILRRAVSNGQEEGFRTAGDLAGVLRAALAKDRRPGYQLGDTRSTTGHTRLKDVVGLAPAEPEGEWTLDDAAKDGAERSSFRRRLIGGLGVASLLGVVCAAALVVSTSAPVLWGRVGGLMLGPTAATPRTALPTAGSGWEANDAVGAATPLDSPAAALAPAMPMSAGEQLFAPNVQMVMDADSATVINLAAGPLSLAGVALQRVARDGAITASFQTWYWNRVAGSPVDRLPPGDCYQVRRLATELEWPSICDVLQGWLATANADWYFWIPAEEGDTLRVVRGGDLVHTCVIPASRCVFYLPPP